MKLSKIKLSKVELNHSFRWCEFELSVVRAALNAARTVLNQEPSVSIDVFTHQKEGMKMFILTNRDVTIIANGLVLISDLAEYNFQGSNLQGSNHIGFESVYNRIQRHLGKEFLY